MDRTEFTMWLRFNIALAALVVVSLFSMAQQAYGAQPHRDDRGDLIVLDVYGSYRDMGRQQVELLGDEANRQSKERSAFFEQTVAGQGLIARAFNSALLAPILSFASLFERSGFYDELDGVAEGLGISRTAAFRVYAGNIFGTVGSTVFAATRSATADHGAMPQC